MKSIFVLAALVALCLGCATGPEIGWQTSMPAPLPRKVEPTKSSAGEAIGIGFVAPLGWTAERQYRDGPVIFRNKNLPESVVTMLTTRYGDRNEDVFIKEVENRVRSRPGRTETRVLVRSYPRTTVVYETLRIAPRRHRHECAVEIRLRGRATLLHLNGAEGNAVMLLGDWPAAANCESNAAMEALEASIKIVEEKKK